MKEEIKIVEIDKNDFLENELLALRKDFAYGNYVHLISDVLGIKYKDD